MVEASLACPVSHTLLHHHLLFLSTLLVTARVLFVASGALPHLFPGLRSSKNGIHMLGFALVVCLVLRFLASEALFSALKVVVLAFVALPTSLREVEITIRLLLLFLLW